MADPSFELSGARRMYWAFHWGMPPRRNVRMLGPRGIPDAVAQLGALVALELASGARLVPAGRVQLATDSHGRALYLVAREDISLPPGTATGRLRAIEYRTNKGRRTEVWRHDFDARPLLAVDDHGWPVIRRAGSKFRVTWRGIVG